METDSPQFDAGAALEFGCAALGIFGLTLFYFRSLPSSHTVFPPTIVRTARPFSFQPSNGVFREREKESSFRKIQSRSGSIRVTSASDPGWRVPFGNLVSAAGLIV